MTEKLFYQDSHLTTFSARVESCEQAGDFYEVVLSRTAFFPTGGGQDADTGILGNVRVLDVNERGDVICHITDGPLPEGEIVEGQIDWEERFSKMQQHSGEHIVSGLVHAKYGYNNVGFHMGADTITMDYDGVLTLEQLHEIELEANRVVVGNHPVISLFPTTEEVEHIEFRSKKELAGQIRLVEIPGIDRCACCAPQVKHTGEIGMIRLLGLQSYKGGVRVYMLCGFRALEDYYRKSLITKGLSGMLSASEPEIIEEVSRLKDDLADKKKQIEDLKQSLLEWKVKEIPDGEDLVMMFEELEGNGPRELMNLLIEKGTGVAAVFSGNDGEGYRYVIGSRQKDTRVIAKKLNETFCGRGGGKPEMVQGSLAGEAAAIRKLLQNC